MRAYHAQVFGASQVKESLSPIVNLPDQHRSIAAHTNALPNKLRVDVWPALHAHSVGTPRHGLTSASRFYASCVYGFSVLYSPLYPSVSTRPNGFPNKCTPNGSSSLIFLTLDTRKRELGQGKPRHPSEGWKDRPHITTYGSSLRKNLSYSSSLTELYLQQKR